MLFTLETVKLSPEIISQFPIIELDECVSQPCANNGKCTDKVNSFVCLCPEQYTGARCEEGRCNYKILRRKSISAKIAGSINTGTN